MWMISRLSKHIKECIEEGESERCRRNSLKRQIMAVNVLKICRRDPSQRHRAMWMMQRMDDIWPGRGDSEENSLNSVSS